jgi:WhiB family redox-sensing transcriptional regulator
MSEDWRDEGACRAEDPELFFPVGSTGPAIRQAAKAKAWCARCPVRAECREWAIGSGQVSGVWGGLDELELKTAIRRRGGRPAELPEVIQVKLVSSAIGSGRA